MDKTLRLSLANSPQGKYTDLRIAEALGGIGTIAGSYFVCTDADTGMQFRTGVRESAYVVDKQLTVLGFAGVEGVDWENLLTQM